MNSPSHTNEEQKKSFSKRLLSFRQKENLHLFELAKIFNISSPTLSRWEKCTVLPNKKRHMHIAKVLGVSSEELFQPTTSGPLLKDASLKDIFTELEVRGIIINIAKQQTQTIPPVRSWAVPE